MMHRWKRILDRLDGFSVRATLALLALAGALGVAAVVGLGLYNVSARAGHFLVTRWLLHETFDNSVALRADAVPSVDLDTPAMVALGAGHFEQGCSGCHGRPGMRQSATSRAMEPLPPHVEELAADWTPSELHFIIHEGVKMTGMPAWPATRNDDVWPVVAFLRTAQDMRSDEYQRLTGDAQQGRCSMCHGNGGRSDNPHIPRLDILSPEYIAASLQAYRDGLRDSGIMAEAASRLDPADISRIANSFDPPPATSPRRAEPAMTSQEESLANSSDMTGRPACVACHGPWPERLNPAFPSLAGQHSVYLAQQLRLWRDGPRGDGEMAKAMYKAAQDLTDDEISALAAYYADLPPRRINPVEAQ
jgi:cytochrome c553